MHGDADTGRNWTRRDLGRAVAGAAILATVGGGAAAGAADDSPLAEFVRALDPERRRALVLPADDPRRAMVQNHWAVVPGRIADLTAAQQELALGLIRRACSPDGFDRLTRARLDDHGGWKHDHIAVFGDPADPARAEWVVTGRHLTLRGAADGIIAGGPLFLGHSAPVADGAWRDAAGRAGMLWEALDTDQRGRAARAPGLDLGELAASGRGLARDLLWTLVDPFRAFAVPGVRAVLEPRADWAGVRWEAYPDRAGVPRAWRLAGPGFRWSFHADPHAHAWFDAG